jgi:hypothetical protein
VTGGGFEESGNGFGNDRGDVHQEEKKD